MGKRYISVVLSYRNSIAKIFDVKLSLDGTFLINDKIMKSIQMVVVSEIEYQT